MKNQIDALIMNYVKHPTKCQDTNSIITNIREMQCVTKTDMVNIFNSISNYHWIDYPRFKNRKGVKDNLTRYSSHLLWFADDRDRRNHLPTSPRLCLLQFYYLEQEHNHAIHPLVTQLIEKDTRQGVEFSIPPAKKRKKITHFFTVRLTANQMWKMTNQVDFNEYCNHAAEDRTLYTKFMEQILMEGNIKWRFHDECTDICMINDVDRDSGVIKHNSFAHVTYATDVSGQIILRCTCDTYEFIQTTAHQQNPIWSVEDIVPHTSFTCPHCQFFSDHLLNAYTTVLSQPVENLPPALAMVKKSLGYINKPYVLMGNVHSNSTTKFSIKGFEENTYSTVNVTFEHRKCVVTCTNGMFCRNAQHGKSPQIFKSHKSGITLPSFVHICTAH